MLLYYDMENNLSVKERQRISLVADNKKENIDCVIDTAGFKVVPVVAIYGKNASGKTNLIKGLLHISKMVEFSPNFDPLKGIPLYEPFKFTDEKNTNSKSEVSFTINNKRYTYGFSHDGDEIVEEYLYVFNSQKASKIFDKELGEENYTFGTDYGMLEEYVEKTQKNKLLLSTIAYWAKNQPEIKEVYDFFSNGIIYYQKNCRVGTIKVPKNTRQLLLGDEKARVFLKKLIKYLDMEIVDIEVKNMDIQGMDLDKAPENIKKFIEFLKEQKNNFISTDEKTIYDIGGKEYKLDLNDESNGIQKIYQLFPFIYYGLTSKKIIVIDELETALHPLLVKGIISLFQDKDINKYNSQLIFTTHFSTVLDLSLLRRDEIWFADRTAESGYSTEAYSLADIKGVRTTDNIERDYLAGEYSIIPRIIAWDELRG